MTPVGRVLVGAGFGFGVALLVAACVGGPDCGVTREIRSNPYVAPRSIVLDAAHPVAEQRVVVHLNAAALPTEGSFDARLYVLDAEEASASPTPAPTAASSEAPPRPVDVTVIREDTDTVIPASAPWEWSIFNVGRPFAAIPIDCPAGSDCDRTYRIRFALSEEAAQVVPLTWTVLSRVTYEGVKAPCGMPSEARTDVETAPPAPLPAAHVATTAKVGQEDAGGSLVLRHLTVTSDQAATGASLHLAIGRRGFESLDDPAWRQWVRVIQDDAVAPLADALVGAEPYVGTPVQGGTLDVPVLVDCPAGAPCERGYWLVFQNFAAAPRPAAWGPDRPLPSLGKMTWTASASATYGKTVGTGTLGLTIDDDPLSGSGTPDAVAASISGMNVSGGDAPTAVDITFTAPPRPASQGDLDRFAPVFAVVHIQASGQSLYTSLDRDGAGPLTAYMNGDGTTNLVAHPLDVCPTTGPCSAVVRLLAGGTLPFSPTERGTGQLDVSVDLVAAPGGSTISIGEPYVVPSTPLSAAPPIEPLAIVAVVGLGLLVLVVVRQRRSA